MIYIILIVLLVLWIYLCYCIDIRKAKKRLHHYIPNTFKSTLGNIKYLDRGDGDTILISHGIFGGYDQGFISLESMHLSNYRKISPSCFGYLGSEAPSNPSPLKQAQAYKELLDSLAIEKTFILATSAGGAAALQFAIHYPERTKGLILLSSGAPDKEQSLQEIKDMGPSGPPSIILHNFIIWFSLKFFGSFFNKMFGSKQLNTSLMNSLLPVNIRRQGIIIDTKYTNTDMNLHYQSYPLEKIQCPILVIHAKNDPMAKFENIEKLLHRVNAETLLSETGGHLLEGFDFTVSLKAFLMRCK